MGNVGEIAEKMSVSRNLQPVKNVYARAQIQKVPGNMYQIHLNTQKKIIGKK
jgi:hypothetical protein